MPGIHENIRAKRPSLVNLGVINIIVTSMKRIISSTVLKQWYGKEWILSEVIVNIVWVYTYWSCDDADDNFSKNFDTMVEERGNSQDT